MGRNVLCNTCDMCEDEAAHRIKPALKVYAKNGHGEGR